jgi:hypothetical protein
VSERARRLAAAALVVVASAAIVLALLVGYVRRAAVDSGQFANRATAALDDDALRSVIAQRVTDELIIRNESDLIAARPLIESIVSSVVGGRAFQQAFRAGVRDVHRAVFDHDQHTLTLTVSDIGTIVAAGLEVVRPKLAKQVRATARVELVHRDIGSATAKAARIADAIKLLTWVLIAVALAASAGAIAMAADRRRAIVQLGVGTGVGAFVLLVALAVAHSIVIHSVSGSDARDAADAVWDAFLADLTRAAWILAGIGAVVAAAAASLIRPVDLELPLRQAAAVVVRDPVRRRYRVLRGVTLIAVGLLLVLDRGLVLQILFTVAGLCLVFAGVSALLELVYRPPGKGEERPDLVPGSARTYVAIGLAGLLIVAAAGAFVSTGGTSAAAPAGTGCDGHVELCDRPLDQVALPATHNSMSVPLPGWFAALQERPIAEQLRDGIRGLLIDTHYADHLPNGRLRTAETDTAKLRRDAVADGVSPAAIDAAVRTRDRLGFQGKGERGMYLCHSFCELGGTPLASVLTDLHDFLVANPDEVVVVINQDYVTPEDFVGAVRRAGLDELAYRGPTGQGQWPTLRRMIATNQRVVFLAEYHAGAAPWYHQAYEAITKETPYAFSKPAQLTDPAQRARSCRANRGPEDAPLFLVNHWITTDPLTRPSIAAAVNAYAPLLARLKTCREQRHHIPNLVAVNFYLEGDVFRAVDALNGVPVPP